MSEGRVHPALTAGARAAESVAVYSADARPRLWENFKKVVAHRELLFAIAERDLRVRYKQTFLGAVWAVLPAVLMMVVFNIFLGRFGRSLSEGFPYPVFAYSGLIFWNYFASVISAATGSITGSYSIITKVAFPREILPWTRILSSGVDLLVALSLFGVLLLFYHVHVSWTVVLAVPILAIQVILMAAFALTVAALNAHYRDVQYVVPLVLQAWMFMGPVVYSTQHIPGSLRWLYGILNPMALVIDAYRQVILKGQVPDPRVMLGLFAGAAALFVVCYTLFKRADRFVADVV